MMKKAVYKKIDERIEQVTVYHEPTVDEQGNSIDGYYEDINVTVPIMGTVYEDMTQEEVDALQSEVVEEPVYDTRIEELEKEVNDLKELIKQLIKQ